MVHTPVSLAYLDTVYSADSIEFCPHAPGQDIFVCGTYQLLDPKTLEPAPPPASAGLGTGGPEKAQADGTVKENEKEEKEGDDGDEEEEGEETKKTPPAPRVGKLYLFRAEDGGKTVTELQTVESPAILDSEWSPVHSSTPELAVADAKAGLSLYNLRTKSGHTYLTLNQRLDVVDDESTLVLSLDYEPLRTSASDTTTTASTSSSGRIMTSLSSGHLALISRDTEAHVSQIWKAHDFEPWVTAWDPWAVETVWSGGDDLKLKRWDLRMTEMPTFTGKRFEGGVTTITPSPHDEYLLAVGSYDSHLRLFDTRNPSQPIWETEMPGSIWRTRFHPSPSRSRDILTACMYGGFHVVRIPPTGDLLGKTGEAVGLEKDRDADTESPIVASFRDHKSIAYGTDWCRSQLGDAGDDTSLVASCSFYDHALHLWRG